MVSRLFLLLALLLAPCPAMAQSLEGHWALRIDDATIFVFRLDRLPDGTWSGAWKRPTEITSNGAVFQAMSGSEVVAAQRSGEQDGEVRLVFPGPPGAAGGDLLRFRQTGTNQAQLVYVGVPGDPFPLIRVRPDIALGPFDDGRIYDRDLAVVEADYEAPPPTPAPGVAATEDRAGQDAELLAEAAEEARPAAGNAAATLAGALPPRLSLEALELEPLDEATAPAPRGAPAAAADAASAPTVSGEGWQPLGLIDDATAAAAAAAALGEPAPARAPAALPVAEPEAQPEAPRIDENFLDD
jgi:hypothetical protein